MPAVRERTIRLTQTLWKRVSREFCDGCGMTICDDHFYRWAVSIQHGDKVDWIMSLDSHMWDACSGAVVGSLMRTMHAPE